MTDIQKHLPKIFHTIRAHLQIMPSEPTLYVSFKETIREALIRLIPTSYGVRGGVIYNTKGQISQSVDIVIYDKNKIVKQETTNFPVQCVLAAIQLTPNDLLHQALETIKSVKVLKKIQAISISPDITPDLGTRNDHIPKQLLPLGIIFASGKHYTQGQNDQLCVTLHEQLNHYEKVQRPDYLFLPAYQVYYRNPDLDLHTMTVGEMGLFREPEHSKFLACYICKKRFFRRHFFYNRLCPQCGDFNYKKRSQRADLHGQIALVTGGRIKIGFEVALKLLRAGAFVIVTTRFPHNAALRYSQEPDFSTWSHRLHVYGLDLRHLPSIEHFTQHMLTNYSKLDILINNAAQTVRKPPAFYAHLIPFEMLAPSKLPPQLHPLLAGEDQQVVDMHVENKQIGEETNPLSSALALRHGGQIPLPAALSQVPLLPGDEVHDSQHFPPGVYDRDGQQLDRRPSNSWVMKLEDVSIPELLEVQMINAIAPTIFISQLKPLLLRNRVSSGYIVNVSAIEGQFDGLKLPYHPHTNMAKAALNMLTYTAAPDYARENIFMNSVDPGWVSHQIPISRNVPGDVIPLDEIDGGARICDPIFVGYAKGQNTYGKLFKDYTVTDW